MNNCMERNVERLYQSRWNCKKSATSASENLFNTQANAIFLKETQDNMYLKKVFVTKRERTDIHITISFLTMQVRDPEKDDRKKLLRMMRYLCGTPKVPLNLPIEITNIVKW